MPRDRKRARRVLAEGPRYRTGSVRPPEAADRRAAAGDVLLVRAPNDLLVATPASKRVNSAANEGPGCWKAEDEAEAEEQLRLALAVPYGCHGSGRSSEG